MVWIKRNLFFVIGTSVALLLLLVALVYSYKNWSQNQTDLVALNEAYNTLRDLNNQSPSPSTNNIALAREQEGQFNAWLETAGKYFQPIPFIPVPNKGDVDPKAFAFALPRTIDLLMHEAESAGVMLPPRYGFSFEAEQPKVKFAPGSPILLARQLGEVKAIAEILFAAKINALDGLQRERVSDDDVGGTQLNYLTDSSTTNDLAILTPYIVTFRAFSHELSQVVTGFAKSPNGFIVQAISVEPATGDMSPPPTTVMTEGTPPRGYRPGGYPQPGYPQTMVPVVGKGGLPTVLDEQLLRITMSVQVVKMLPKK